MAVLKTWNPTTVPNETYDPASITTSENQVNIQALDTANTIAAVPVGGPAVIQLRSDQDWYYRSAAGGNNFAVLAGDVFNLRIPDLRTPTKVFVLAQTTAGTLWGTRIR